MTSLRQKLRKIGISAQPWKIKRGEIRLLPISAQTLFKNKGLPADIWEIELKAEGFLFEDEELMEVLNTNTGLSRQVPCEEVDNEYPWDDTWTEEDFINFFENK